MPILHRLTLTLAALAFLTAPALADDRPEDHIILELATEGWVETQTAEVTVTVNATMRQEEAGNVRGSILDTLGNLARGSEWRIVNFRRQEDRSGLDSWFIMAQARIGDTALDGLREAAKNASEPGLNITVSNINFTPTLAEVQATRATLRQQLYTDVKAELERVNEAFPEAPYRISMIDFTEGRYAPPPMADKAYATRAMAESSMGASQIAVEDRIQMQVSVVLARGEDDEEN